MKSPTTAAIISPIPSAASAASNKPTATVAAVADTPIVVKAPPNNLPANVAAPNDFVAVFVAVISPSSVTVNA